jgi:hypothetical protein
MLAYLFGYRLQTVVYLFFKLKHMKKILLSVIVLGVLSAPYFIGKLQHNNVIAVVQNLMNDDGEDGEFGTDADIENTLAVFNFDLKWHETPSFVDLYNSGLITIGLK